MERWTLYAPGALHSMHSRFAKTRVTLGRWRLALVGVALVSTISPAHSASAVQATELKSATRNIHSAVEAIDWRKPDKAKSFAAIQRQLSGLDLKIALYDISPPSADIPRRMVARFEGSTCLTPATWGAGVGLPVRLDLQMTHQLQPETRPPMIRQLLSDGGAQFGPIAYMYYPPIETQPEYRIMLGWNNGCLSDVYVVPTRNRN